MALFNSLYKEIVSKMPILKIEESEVDRYYTVTHSDDGRSKYKVHLWDGKPAQIDNLKNGDTVTEGM